MGVLPQAVVITPRNVCCQLINMSRVIFMEQECHIVNKKLVKFKVSCELSHLGSSEKKKLSFGVKIPVILRKELH